MAKFSVSPAQTQSLASGAQVIDGSLRFERANGNYLTRAIVTEGNRKTWTYSCWIKRDDFPAGSRQLWGQVASAGSSATGAWQLYYASNEALEIHTYSLTHLKTNALFRDTGWYHVVQTLDTTLGSSEANNRCRLYINGVEQTSFATRNNPTLDQQLGVNTVGNMVIGTADNAKATYYINAEMTQCYFIDGQALGPENFGYTDPLTNTWRPKKFSGEFTTGGDALYKVLYSAGIAGTLDTTAAAAFDGIMGGSDSDGAYPAPGQTLTWTPANSSLGTTLPYSSTARVYVKVDPNGDDGGLTVVGANGSQTISAGSAGQRYVDISAATSPITSIAWSRASSGSQGVGLQAVEIDGTILIDFNGRNSFYLPLDGNSPIGKDQSGKGNDWTPVNFGGSNVISKATGALPILNTINGGNVATAGVRTDTSGNSCVLALPLVGNANDVSNQINSGSTTKTITATGTPTASTTTSNFYGTSYYFDGSGDYLAVTDSTDLKFGTGDYTIEFWVKPASVAYYWMFSKRNNYADVAPYTMMSTPSGNFEYASSSNDSGYNIVQASFGSYAANAWTHVAVVKNGGVITGYCNGVGTELATGVTLGPFEHAEPLHIGDMPTGGSYDFSGYMQDFRIYKGAAKYTEDFIPASTNPDIFPETPSGVALSSNLTKLSDITTDGAVSFDGSGDYLSLADSADWNLAGNDFTIEAFVYHNDTDYGANGGYDAVMGQYVDNSGADRMFAWETVGSGDSADLEFYYYTDDDVFHGPVQGAALGKNRWYHVAIVRNGNSMVVYIDGVGGAVTTETGNLKNSSNLMTIGGGVAIAAGGGYWPGFISNVRFINGTALYTANFTPPTGPLTNVTNTKLLCCQSPTSAIEGAVKPGAITANGDSVSTHFNPFTDDINTVMGQETGYATFNPLRYSGYTTSDRIFTDGNLRMLGRGDGVSNCGATTGKFYAEVFVERIKSGESGQGYIGLISEPDTFLERAWPTAKIAAIRDNVGGGDTLYGDGKTSTTTTWTEGDTLSVAFNADAAKVWIAKNGNWINGGTPATGGTPLFTGITFKNYYFLVSDNNPSSNQTTDGNRYQINFGQKPFKYVPPDGFQPLNYANLPSPGVVRPDQYVGISTYDGDDSSETVNIGFKPDLIVTKCIDSGSYGWRWVDSVRGISKYLMSHSNASEQTEANGITSLDSGGYTVGSAQDWNKNGQDFIGYSWKAGGNKNTFNVDGVGYANASDVNMSVGSVNNYYNQAATWSDNLSVSSNQWGSGQGPEKAFNGVAGPSTNMAQRGDAAGGTITWTFSGLSGSCRVWIGNAGGTVTDGNGTVRGNNVGNGETWISLSGDISDYGGSIVISVSSDAPSLGGVEVAGKMLVDDDQTPPNLPSIASTGASVGTKQGFSIIKYTGTGANATVSHGLGKVPKFMIIKNLDDNLSHWVVYHHSLGTGEHALWLNEVDADQTTFDYWDGDPTSTVFTLGAETHASGTNLNGKNYINYIWSDVPGLQKFGSYVGNSSNDGQIVECGFEPAFILIKVVNDSNSWYLHDIARTPINVSNDYLNPNLAAAQTVSSHPLDILSNGFKLRNGSYTGYNGSYTYIYAAWAENPMNNLYGGQSNAR